MYPDHAGVIAAPTPRPPDRAESRFKMGALGDAARKEQHITDDKLISTADQEEFNRLSAVTAKAVIDGADQTDDAKEAIARLQLTLAVVRMLAGVPMKDVNRFLSAQSAGEELDLLSIGDTNGSDNSARLLDPNDPNYAAKLPIIEKIRDAKDRDEYGVTPDGRLIAVAARDLRITQLEDLLRLVQNIFPRLIWAMDENVQGQYVDATQADDWKTELEGLQSQVLGIIGVPAGGNALGGATPTP